MSWSFVENNDSAENGCGAVGCEGVLAEETTGGGNGAANSGAGNDDGGTEECDVGGCEGVGPPDETEGGGGVGRDREEELLFTRELAAGECDGGAPTEDAAAEGGRVGGQPGGPAGKLVLPLELLLVVTDASEGLG